MRQPSAENSLSHSDAALDQDSAAPHARIEYAPQTSSPLRVLIVAPSLDILGGQSVQAARLLERLQQEPSLEMGFLPVNPRLPGALRKLQNIKYVRTIVTSVLYIAMLFKRVPSFDVVHIFSASYFSFVIAPTPAILVSRFYGKKIVLDYHSGQAEDHLRRWRRTAIPILRLANRITVQTNYLAHVFARFHLRARPIFNIVDTGQFHFRSRTHLQPRFLSNRNFEPHYNVSCVLRAFAEIQQSFPEASLTIAGDGSQRAELEELARKLKLRNGDFIGRVVPARMPELYDEADIYLNASDIDNMPLSILESYAAGVPVVTTNAGGIPLIVRNGETGFLVERGDYKAMAECAVRLLQDDALASRIAEEAREECRKYDWGEVRKEWLGLYHELAPHTKTATQTERITDETVSEH